MNCRDVKPPNMKIKAGELQRGDIIYLDVPPAQATNSTLTEPFYVHELYVMEDRTGIIFYHARHLDAEKESTPVPAEIKDFNINETLLTYRYSLNKILTEL